MAFQASTVAPEIRSPRVSELLVGAAAAVREAAAPDAANLDDIALWCAELGAIDARLQLAALRQAYEVIARDRLIEDLLAALRLRMQIAGPYLATLRERGELPRLLVAVGLDDVSPPDGAVRRPLPPRVARFYWQRLRAFVAWTAARSWVA